MAEAKVQIIKGDAGGTVPVRKAQSSTQLDVDAFTGGYGDILEPPYPIGTLLQMREISTILPQCLDAYKRNIVGFGAAAKYREDKKEDNAMKEEWDYLLEWKKDFNYEKSFEDVWATAIEHREACGNGYVEIIRDGKGLPVGGENMQPDTVRCTKLGERVEVKGRFRRFRKYVQRINGETVWFKEFGDPRLMDNTTGNYVTGPLSIERVANEVLHLKIGDDGAYGVPRWISQMIHMYGARKAEELNYRYFRQGRHTPLAFILTNARLTPESSAMLTQYAQAVEGVDNSHKFMVVEVDSSFEADPTNPDAPQPKVELKPLAEILQQDALFLDYDEASREKVQSSFRLPDIYVGRSKDFNRATADTARSITEEQVFEPERNSLEWIINNVLLADHDLKHVELAFGKPKIGDIKDMAALLAVLDRIGAMAPNDARDLAAQTLDKTLEPFVGDQYNFPYAKSATGAKPPAETPQGGVDVVQLAKDAGIIAILKDLRDAIEEMRAA